MTGPYRSRALLSPEGPRAWLAWLAFGLMSFLTASLMIAALVGGLMARDLTSRLTGSATVLVRGGGLESDDAAAARAAERLEAMGGVTGVGILEPDPADGTIADLIEARAPASAGGPTRLVRVSFAAQIPGEAGRIARDLEARGLRVTVDDNHLWTSHLWRAIGVAAGVVAAAWLALVLVAAFTLGSRSRACVNGHRDLVALLHLTGANDGYIAGLFRRRLGLRAAMAAGLGSALAMAAALAWKMAAAPGLSWLALSAALPWPAIVVAAAIGARHTFDASGATPEAMKAVALVLVLLVIWMAGLLEFGDRVARLTPADDPPTADGIVALTGGSDQRLEAATRLLEAGKGKRLLVSGVNPMATRQDLWGVTGAAKPLFDCCVDLGFTAADTVGNAREAAEWARSLGYRRLILVTADYHMPRAMLELRAALPAATITSYPVATRDLDAQHWRASGAGVRRVAVEYCKYLARLARETLLGLGAHGGAPAGTTST